jgi:hypothetical protein
MRKPFYQRHFKCVKACSHNGKAYDNQFLLKTFVEDYSWTPSIIMTGLNILSMSIPNTNISFIDSCMFLPLPLSELPRTFSFEESVKGYFPFFFNPPSDNYVGIHPSVEDYGFNTMTDKKREEFMVWYNKVKHLPFNYNESLKIYCINDVEILGKSCIKFRRDLIHQNDLDPFLNSITISSAANIVFRKNFLKDEQIGIIPKNGYRLSDTQSNVAIQWMVYEEKNRGINIQHSGNAREYKVPGIGKVV